MAWYRTGTISIPSGSKAVTGNGTTFNDTAAGVNPGDMIIVGGQFLEVATVNSATSITTVNASTAAVSNAAYQIVTTVQMSNATLAKKVAAAMDRIITGISNWMLIFKGSGDITITNYDGSTATGKAWPTLSALAASAVQQDGSVAMTGTLRGASAQFSGAMSVNSIELFGAEPYIDFHLNNTTADLDVRLANRVSGGLAVLNANNGYGIFEAADFRVRSGGIIRWYSANGDKQFNIQVIQSTSIAEVSYTGVSRFHLNGLWTTGGGFTALANNATLTQQGMHMVWNESGDGAGSIVVNKGAGAGGFKLRLVNAANTTEDAKYNFATNGVFGAPNGSTSVNGRVRSFTSVGSGYLEVAIDGAAYGINFFSSDKTLKENIKNADVALAKDIISKVRPVSYKFKDRAYTYEEPQDDGTVVEKEGVVEGAEHAFGVIAQELELLLPSAVITASDGKKSLDPLECIGLLLTLAAEQSKEIGALTSRLDKMESGSEAQEA